MSLHNLPLCPACKSEPEDYYFGGIIIACSRANCGVSTGNEENMIAACEAWKKVCEYFPAPVPDREELK